MRNYQINNYAVQITGDRDLDYVDFYQSYLRNKNLEVIVNYLEDYCKVDVFFTDEQWEKLDASVIAQVVNEAFSYTDVPHNKRRILDEVEDQIGQEIKRRESKIITYIEDRGEVRVLRFIRHVDNYEIDLQTNDGTLFRYNPDTQKLIFQDYYLRDETVNFVNKDLFIKSLNDKIVAFINLEKFKNV